jgi:hypothetical protein
MVQGCCKFRDHHGRAVAGSPGIVTEQRSSQHRDPVAGRRSARPDRALRSAAMPLSVTAVLTPTGRSANTTGTPSPNTRPPTGPPISHPRGLLAASREVHLRVGRGAVCGGHPRGRARPGEDGSPRGRRPSSPLRSPGKDDPRLCLLAGDGCSVTMASCGRFLPAEFRLPTAPGRKRKSSSTLPRTPATADGNRRHSVGHTPSLLHDGLRQSWVPAEDKRVLEPHRPGRRSSQIAQGPTDPFGAKAVPRLCQKWVRNGVRMSGSFSLTALNSLPSGCP